MVPPTIKKEFQASLQIINYMSKFSPSAAETCESLRQLTLAKAECIWNANYQRLFNKVKLIIKEDACLKFYDEMKSMYLQTDAFGVGLRTTLLQKGVGTSCPRGQAPDNNILRLIAFTKKRLLAAVL